MALDTSPSYSIPPKSSISLKISIKGDILMGRPANDPGSAPKPATRYWQLVLGELGVPKYIIYIDKIFDTPFWAQPSDSQLSGYSTTFPRYVLSTVSLDPCNVELCRPELGDEGFREKFPGITGTVAIFQGDLYDSKKYTVQESPSNPDDPDSDVFNIACFGTTIAKLHFLRHASASQVLAIDSNNPTPKTVRFQTMLRLLTADYCGIGHPFTMDGIPLQLGFNNPNYKLTTQSRYIMQSTSSIDAFWRSDGSGSACLGVPRNAEYTIDDINQICNDIIQSKINTGEPIPPHNSLPIQSCANLPDVSLGGSNYGVSRKP